VSSMRGSSNGQKVMESCVGLACIGASSEKGSLGCAGQGSTIEA
jgi:hypothetical protein